MLARSVFIASSLLSIAASTAVVSRSASTTCDEITRALPKGRVVLPGSAPYITENNNYWSATLMATKPACIVMAASADEVSTFVKIIKGKTDIKWAFKSGGHSPNIGYGSTDGGVLLSMANMKGATYDADKQVAYVLPGGHWKDVIADIAPYQRTVVGGRLDMVGVGGFLTGGGISFLSPQYGMASDNVINFETVMANGSIVNVNAQTNPDLLVAMRGGGNQFGIVTKFTMKTVPIGTNGKVWGGPIAFSDGWRREILAAFQDFTANPVDPKASIILSLTRVASGGIWMLHRFYDGEKAPKGVYKGFEDLWHLPGMDFGSTQTYGELLALDSSGGDILAQARTGFRAMTLPLLPGKNGVDTLDDIVATWWRQFQAYKDNDWLSICSIALQSFPSTIGKVSSQMGGNTMNLTANDGPRVMLEFATVHTAPSSDALGLAAGQASELLIGKQVAQRVAALESMDRVEWKIENNLPLSLNHAASDQDVYSTYSNFAKFRDLQKSVDPEGLWTRTGGFKFKQ